MENPTSISDLARALYADRTGNDLDKLSAWHTDDATFEMPNMPGDMGKPTRLADLLDTLVSVFRWDDVDIKSVHCADQTATVRLGVTITHIPSGQTHSTECLDLITFDDNNRVKTYVQYVDTALVTSLLADGS